MTIDEHIAAAKAAINEGRAEAAAHIVAVLELDPQRPRATLCKEIDPEGWRALEARVIRLQDNRRSGGESGITPDGRRLAGGFRATKDEIRRRAERDPEFVRAVVEAAPAEVRRTLGGLHEDERAQRAAIREFDTPRPLDLIARARRLVDDMERLVRDTSAVDLADDMRDALDAACDRLTTDIDMLRTAVHSTFNDNELQEWIGGE